MTPGTGYRARPEEAETSSWPALIGQLIVDFTGVVEAQVRLARASIAPALTEVLNRWLLQIIVGSVALIGLLLLLCASVLLLHQWLQWWEACGIVGAVCIVAAIGALASLADSGDAKKPSA
jgi:Putative Actinobacterial Holin-X, holin superfamily III